MWAKVLRLILMRRHTHGTEVGGGGGGGDLGVRKVGAGVALDYRIWGEDVIPG